MSDAAQLAQRLAEELAASRKYRFLCPQTLSRVVARACAQAASPREASELARRKLHQAYGAYLAPGQHRAVAKILAGLAERPAPAEVEAACRRILGLHVSTRERLAILDRCFGELFAITGTPRSVVDLACGLGAFALPWMGLNAAAAYVPLDIDTRLAELSNRLLGLLGRPAAARCLDLLAGEPFPEADVALLLKAVPCLERQERGAAAAVLARIPARAVVISFPLKSLGGRERGMREGYDRLIRALLPAGEVREIAYPQEVFYVWSKAPGQGGAEATGGTRGSPSRGSAPPS